MTLIILLYLLTYILTHSFTHSMEQSPSEANRFPASQEIPRILWNPKFHSPPHITWKDHSCFSLQPGHYSSLTEPNLQPTANQGMYNFRFTILINTNNTSNYQSTNETHYTQQNTKITTHTKNHNYYNLLKPNVNYSGRTAPLTSKVAYFIYLFNKYGYWIF